ncbi:hypothetical protein [Sphingomonas sp. SRS2]|nr:hypothetical protein [Sphingomonas sp. SRS2]
MVILIAPTHRTGFGLRDLAALAPAETIGRTLFPRRLVAGSSRPLRSK